MELPNLPEDVVTEILARIPALQLLKFRRVCRRWNDLISMQYFQNMHLIRSKQPDSPSSPIILIEMTENYPRDYKLIIIEESEQRQKPKPPPPPMFLNHVLNFEKLSLNTVFILFSQNGFIVMNKENCLQDYVIYNPVTEEKVEINISILTRPAAGVTSIWALFFNPWINQYCVIFGKRGSDTFQILNLGSRPYIFKPLKAPKNIQFRPRLPPVVINNNANIYWHVKYLSCEQSILAFNIKTEEFSLFPHPHLPYPYSLNECIGHDQNMHIADIHGRLSCVHIAIIDSVVIFNIWTTEAAHDTQQQQQQQSLNWIKIYSVAINEFNFGISPLISIFQVLKIQNGEMVFMHIEGIISRVFGYNLELQTLTRIYKSPPYTDLFFYEPSFASLKNFESRICI